MPLNFEWDEQKAKTNAAKHGVSFGEAATVFADPLSLTIPNPAHSQAEERFIIFGKSHSGKLLVVVLCGERRQSAHHQRPAGEPPGTKKL